MDASLEIPFAQSPKQNLEGEDEQSSEDESQLDWTKLLSGAARPVIPKRGEKEFEPAPGGGSGLQVHVLEKARSAMYEALRTVRSTSSKTMSYAIWEPALSRAHVIVARGIHFSVMGHSVPRMVLNNDGINKTQKRMELLPEEAIYLIERGALFCWKERGLSFLASPGLEHLAGEPMTVQQAYSEMIGTEDLTIERFQVYAYLKRLGYVVTRANPPNSSYPTPPSGSAIVAQPSTSVFRQPFSVFLAWLAKLFNWTLRSFNWWKPLCFGRWIYHGTNTSYIFRSLRFIPSGHGVPLYSTQNNGKQLSPYRVFFNLYKPSTPFRKTAPPPPDFQVVVVNARTTSMPSLHELTTLFRDQPDLPPPLPRSTQTAISKPVEASVSPSSESRVSRLWGFWKWFPWRRDAAQPSAPARRPNPFAVLKAGKRIIVIAVVDAGSISFFRFGQGAFEDLPML